MRKCSSCSYYGTAWMINTTLEVMCPNCRTMQDIRFVENFQNRELTYQEAIKLYDGYEAGFLLHEGNTKTSWAELDVVLNESISRRIRAISAKDKLA